MTFIAVQSELLPIFTMADPCQIAPTGTHRLLAVQSLYSVDLSVRGYLAK